jgi:phage terminase large subunit
MQNLEEKILSCFWVNAGCKNSSSKSIYNHFEHVIEELGRNHKPIFQEDVTLLLQRF